MTPCPRCAGNLTEHPADEPCWLEDQERRRKAIADAYFAALIRYYSHGTPLPE